jgi:hypothetical protein
MGPSHYDDGSAVVPCGVKECLVLSAGFESFKCLGVDCEDKSTMNITETIALRSFCVQATVQQQRDVG